MQSKNSFDQLAEYAKKHDYVLETERDYERFYLAQNAPSVSSKLVAFRFQPGFWFYASDSYAVKANTGSTFSGVYTTIHLDQAMRCRIYPRMKFDFLFRRSRQKTGNALTDEKLTISCQGADFPKHLIDAKALSLFSVFSGKIAPLSVVVEYDYLTRLPELNQKMIIGLETNQWIHNEHDVDFLLQEGAVLLGAMKKNAGG